MGASKATECNYPTAVRNTGASAKTRFRIHGARNQKLIMLVILFSTLQCGVMTEVCGQSLASTQTPSEAGLDPTAVGTVVPMVGEVQQQQQVRASPLSPPQGQLAQFIQVISALRSNNYTSGAEYISDYLFLLPLESTVFVPSNAAFSRLNRNTAPGPLLAYHAILQQFSYEQLLLFPAGTRFPSFIGNNNSVVITSVTPDDFRVDDVRIVEGNVCSSLTSVLQISCHGIDHILNMTSWGRLIPAQLPPLGSPAPDAPISELTPPATSPTVESPAPAAKLPAGGGSRAETRCCTTSLLSVVFLYMLLAAFTAV